MLWHTKTRTPKHIHTRIHTHMRAYMRQTFDTEKEADVNVRIMRRVVLQIFFATLSLSPSTTATLSMRVSSPLCV